MDRARWPRRVEGDVPHARVVGGTGQAEGDGAEAVLVEADEGVHQARGVRSRYIALAGDSPGDLTVHGVGDDDEPGDAGPVHPSVSDSGRDGRHQHVVHVGRGLHSVVVGVDGGQRLPDRLTERPDTRLLPHRRTRGRATGVRLGLQDLRIEAQVGGRVKRRGVRHGPQRDPVVALVDVHIEGAQEILRVVRVGRTGRGTGRLDRGDGRRDALYRGERKAEVARREVHKRQDGPVHCGLGQPALRHRIELSAVERCSERVDRVLVGAEVEAGGVGTDHRLVAEAGAVGVTGRAVRPVVEGIDAEQPPTLGRVTGLRDGHQRGRLRRKRPTVSIPADFQHREVEALGLGVEVAPRVAQERPEDHWIRLPVDHGRKVEKGVEGGRGDLGRQGPGGVHLQCHVDGLDDVSVADTQALVGRFQALLVTVARRSLVQMVEAVGADQGGAAAAQDRCRGRVGHDGGGAAGVGLGDLCIYGLVPPGDAAGRIPVQLAQIHGSGSTYRPGRLFRGRDGA